MQIMTTNILTMKKISKLPQYHLIKEPQTESKQYSKNFSNNPSSHRHIKITRNTKKINKTLNINKTSVPL